MPPIYYGEDTSPTTPKLQKPQENGENTEWQFLEVENYDIYFYSNVDNSTSAKLVQMLNRLDIAAQKHAIDYGVSPTIKLHIHSYGGYVSSGMAIHDTIKSLRTPVSTYVEGVCASAGTFISLAGDNRYMRKNAVFLIHQLSGVAWGTYEQMKDSLHLADMLMNQVVTLYDEHSLAGRSKIEEMLKRDTWLSPNEAKELGFIDEII